MVEPKLNKEKLIEDLLQDSPVTREQLLEQWPCLKTDSQLVDMDDVVRDFIAAGGTSEEWSAAAHRAAAEAPPAK
jgi:hypothetical protein